MHIEIYQRPSSYTISSLFYNLQRDIDSLSKNRCDSFDWFALIQNRMGSQTETDKRENSM